VTDPQITRHTAARALRELVVDAEETVLDLAPGPVDERLTAIIDWRHGLRTIADLLESSPVVGASGAERALVLVDATRRPTLDSPALAELVWWVMDGVQVCPPHEWGCPIVAKLAPDEVTWTCRRCGAIARGSAAAPATM